MAVLASHTVRQVLSSWGQLEQHWSAVSRAWLSVKGRLHKACEGASMPCEQASEVKPQELHSGVKPCCQPSRSWQWPSTN